MPRQNSVVFVGFLLCGGGLIGCDAIRVNVSPGFEFTPEDRVALIGEHSGQQSSGDQEVVDYLTNEFVALDVTVVERSFIREVLQEHLPDLHRMSESELTSLIARATRANLVGFHRSTEFNHQPVDSDKPSGQQVFHIAALFRVVSVADNKVVLSATANYKKRADDQATVVQAYAEELFLAIKRELDLQARRAERGTPASSPEG